MDKFYEWLDRQTEKRVRKIAQHNGRRSFLAHVGGALIGGAMLPMLPFDRSGRKAVGEAHADEAAADKIHDPTACEYWRNCAIDGYLCSCCGGSITQCPPGSSISKVTWVGTCLNPDDNRHYLVSYNDCCGVSSCGNCLCNNNERERPGYRMGVHNDINWCMANENGTYHCTVSVIVGVEG